MCKNIRFVCSHVLHVTSFMLYVTSFMLYVISYVLQSKLAGACFTAKHVQLLLFSLRCFISHTLTLLCVLYLECSIICANGFIFLCILFLSFVFRFSFCPQSYFISKFLFNWQNSSAHNFGVTFRAGNVSFPSL